MVKEKEIKQIYETILEDIIIYEATSTDIEEAHNKLKFDLLQRTGKIKIKNKKEKDKEDDLI